MLFINGQYYQQNYSEMFHATTNIPVNFKRSLANSSDSYKLIRLPNGITSLLISSPTTAKTACSVSVEAGSHKDPQNISGLAHLCEHMLFVGTNQPSASPQFVDWINAQGGSANAFTTGEQTCFFIEVPVTEEEHNGELALHFALCNFSAFFKNPKFNEKLINKEIAVIQNEHEINITKLEKLNYQGMRLLSSEKHPFHRFSTGSIHTLKEIPQFKSINVRKKLIAYFKENFIGENMNLVIQGPQSLHYLQKLVTANFSDIKRSHANLFNNSQQGEKPLENESFMPKKEIWKQKFRKVFGELNIDPRTSRVSNNPSNIENEVMVNEAKYKVFESNNLNKLLMIKNSYLNFQIFYPLPSYSHPFFEEIWCNILGDENSNSLFNLLAHQLNFITSIFVSTEKLAKKNKIIVLDMKLTSKGCKNLFHIIKATLLHIDQMKNLSIDYLSKFMSQYLTVLTIGFYYKDVQSTQNEVCELALRLKNFSVKNDLENLLKGSRDLRDDYGDISSEYNETNKDYWGERAKEFLDLSTKVFSSNRFNVIIVHPNDLIPEDVINENFINANFDNWERDKYYNFEYKMFTINCMSVFQEPDGQSSINLTENLPSPNWNEFIFHTQLEIDSMSYDLSKTSNTFATTLAVQNDPVPLVTSRYLEAWYSNDHHPSFVCKSTVSFQLQSLKVSCTPFFHMCIELICELYGTRLKTKLYNAELLGFSWGIYPIITGKDSICISISGATRGIFKILQYIIHDFTKFMITELEHVTYKELMKVRVSVRQRYNDLNKDNGITQCVSGSLIFLEENTWALEKRIDSLELVDLESMVEFAKSFFDEKKYIEVLVSGDCGKEVALQLVDEISLVNKGIASDLQAPENSSTYLITPGINYIYAAINSNPDDPVNTLYIYLQFGDRSDPSMRAYCELISYFLSTRASNELRQKKQLGYAVLCNSLLHRATIGSCLIVSSGTHDNVQLLREIEIFIADLELELIGLSEDDFRSQILQPFLTTFQKGRSEEILPHNIWYSLEPLQKSSNFEHNSNRYLHHKNLWEKIFNKSYSFQGSNGHDDVDINILQKVTKQSFSNYFARYISVVAKQRSSLTLMIDTQMDKETAKRKLMKVQVQSILAQQQILLKNEELDELLESCQYQFAEIQLKLLKLTNEKNYRANAIIYSIKKASRLPKKKKQDKLQGQYLRIKGVEEFHRNSVLARS